MLLHSNTTKMQCMCMDNSGQHLILNIVLCYESTECVFNKLPVSNIKSCTWANGYEYIYL